MSPISAESVRALTTRLPEHLVREIVGFAEAPHPTAVMMKDLEFTEERNVPPFDEVDREVAGFKVLCFEVSLRRGAVRRGVYFREARRRDTMRPYAIRRRTYLEMNGYNVEKRTYRAVALERERRDQWIRNYERRTGHTYQTER